MNRLMIMTVGKTHSGKTTFAKALEKKLSNSVIIDQDNHAEILNTYYPALVPVQGPNTIKYAITQTIVEYTVKETNCHIILCNSNLNQKSRKNLMDFFHANGFLNVLVHFNIPDVILEERIRTSERSSEILRTVFSFEEVLIQQRKVDDNPISASIKEEGDYLFTIKAERDVEDVIGKIVELHKNT